MAIYLVNQRNNYIAEHEGGYIWAPTRAKNGSRNKGYENVGSVKKGDIILHNHDQHLVDISIAECDAKLSPRPSETKSYKNGESYNDQGYKVLVKSIGDINPVHLRPLWSLMDQKNKENKIVSDYAFNAKGANQFYLNKLSDEEIKILMNETLIKQTDKDIYDRIYRLFDTDYISPKLSNTNKILDDYSPEELNLIYLYDSVQPSIPSKPQKQVYYKVNNTSEKKPKRNPAYARHALIEANYKCEIDPNDLTFERPNGTQYTEPHHLIPISYCDDFEYSLDDPANIVSLCSHHHNQIHYGKNEDKIELLRKLWDDRKAKLKDRHIYIDFDKLLEYYNIEH